MKIVIFDRYKTFDFHHGHMVSHLGKNHEVLYVDEPIPQDQIRILMRKNDLTWFEFCDDMFREAMRHPKESKVICRLHSFELFTPVPLNTYWLNCDRLLIVSKEIETLMGRVKEKSKIPVPSMDIFPNGVDFNLFEWKGKQYGQKIAWIGWINYKKNPQMILYLADALKKKGMDYTFHAIGRFQDPRYELYLSDMIKKMNLSDTVFFEGWVDNKNLPAWFENKSYNLSTSLFESFGNSIIESMGSGLIPLIHDFYGAGERFGNDCSFTGVDSFVNLLVRFEQLSNEEKQQISKKKKKLVEQYEINKQLSKLDSIINSVMEE